MARRGKVRSKGGHYVERDKYGRFKRWHGVRRSISVDKRRYVGPGRIPRTRTGGLKRGYGHKGDYPRRRRRR